MKQIRFHTTLDAAKPDVESLDAKVVYDDRGAIPRKGDLVLFVFYADGEGTIESRKREFHLEVIDVVWDFAGYEINVYLHIPSYFVADKASVRGWTKWFNSHRYGKGS